MSGQRFGFISPPTSDTPLCNTFNLSVSNQFEVERGDVYSVYLEPGVNTLAILSVLDQAAGRSLYIDRRMSSATSTSGDLRSNNIEVVNNIGMHLTADIGMCIIIVILEVSKGPTDP